MSGSIFICWPGGQVARRAGEEKQKLFWSGLKPFEISCRCIRTLEAHMDAVLSLAGSDACLYSGSADRSVRVWTCRKPNGAQRNLSNDSTGSSPLSRTQSPASLPRSPSMPHSSPGVSGSRHGSIGKLDTLTFPLEHTWEEHGEQVGWI